MNIDVDGASVYIYTGGQTIDASKQSVLFVHGAGLDHTVWTLPARYFVRHGLNVLGVDLPGHGRSGGSPQTSITAMADWLPLVLDACGLSETALVGSRCRPRPIRTITRRSIC